ncbi:MAG: thiamine pyrophosphate-binding protein [Alphaproteobacteria bacterium]|nr:thiamine pyrophosphate-binding protein [Alphaproteobacteria bacterium]MBT4085059.1 thiamine pyrophosphate-binding protein [Alphaproteobacteria bacterium]MBT4546074.1 thiamine pyrophosphate-binding protein [Alphaproteobacteria bacterium]
MAKVDGGELFGKALLNEGIEKAFVLCGGHVMPIFYGMRNAGIEIIDMRHEAAAVQAAIAYTRSTGKMAVVVTTAGPGVANTVTAMMDAEALNIPVLQIGGAVATNKRDAGDLQDMSTLTLMESCCKWARKINATNRIPEYVSMAFRHAQDNSPGPVYLEVPTDLLSTQVDLERVKFPTNYMATSIPGGAPALIEEAAALLASADRPAVVVDDGAFWTLGENSEAISELSDFLKMPIGVVGTGCRGHFGNERENAMVKLNASSKADVVLALGCRFDFRHGSGAAISRDAKIIQVHSDPRQIGFNLRADVGIVGGAGSVAKQILDVMKSKRNPKADESWVGNLGTAGVAGLPSVYRDKKTPAHPARCAGEVAKFLENEAADWNIIVDGGEAYVWMSGAVSVNRPGQFHAHASSPNGNIGTGPPVVVGAWAANQKPCLLFTGDGSFGFYPMELETMARLGIPCVVVLANNSAWGMISMSEVYVRPEEIDKQGQCNTTLPNMVAYEKMAEMFGGHGERVTDPDEILPAIRRAAANGKPSIINVEVDDVSLSPFIAGYASQIKPT